MNDAPRWALLKIDKSRIGHRVYWETNVVARLAAMFVPLDEKST